MVEVTVSGESTPTYLNIDAIESLETVNGNTYVRLFGSEDFIGLDTPLATVLERIKGERIELFAREGIERIRDRKQAIDWRISDLQHRQLMYRVSICALVILAAIAVTLLIMVAK